MKTIWRLCLVIIALVAVVALGAGLLSIVARLFLG
jgi:hypothetical protein